MKSVLKSGLVLSVGFTFLSTTVGAQTTTSNPSPFGHNFQNWNSIGAKFAVGKKTDLHISQMGSFLPSDGYRMNFAQTHLGLSVGISKKFSMQAGDMLTEIPKSSRPLRNRVYLRGTINNKFSELFKAEHALQAEYHDQNEHRYSERFILINSISLRDRFSALRIRPSVSYWLYYNMGGNPIQYYDKSGGTVIAQTPDGLHRGRLYLTLNSKVSKSLRVSAYYMNQQEFNLFTAPNREMNVADPTTGKIQRPFENFNVVGLSLQFVLGKD